MEFEDLGIELISEDLEEDIGVELIGPERKLITEDLEFLDEAIYNPDSPREEIKSDEHKVADSINKNTPKDYNEILKTLNENAPNKLPIEKFLQGIREGKSFPKIINISEETRSKALEEFRAQQNVVSEPTDKENKDSKDDGGPVLEQTLLPNPKLTEEQKKLKAQKEEEEKEERYDYGMSW